MHPYSASTTHPSATSAAETDGGSVCGPFLDRCRCRGRSITPRSPEEMRARHEAAVARAMRSGWGAWLARPQLVTDPTGRRWAA